MLAHTIDKIKSKAHDYNLECLSKIYKNQNTNLRWRCKICKYEFELTYFQLTDRTFPCSNCKEKEWSNHWIKRANEIAKAKNGKCLSTIYKNQNQKLEWECQFGHRWKAKFWNVSSCHHWCPQCCNGSYEELCRTIFEEIFQKPFPKRKPKWLVNEKGNRLELDGYCEELGIAFEHNGMQHYKKISIFKMNDNDLNRNKKHDEIKKEKCQERNIILFQIPELFERTSINKLLKMIKDKCPDTNINIDIDKLTNTIKSRNQHMLEKIKRFAASKDERCISNGYINNKLKLKFKCKNGHTYKRSWVCYVRDLPCPKC